MGSKDVRRRESKKQKKDQKTAVALSPITVSPQVEVLPKRKATKEPKE